MTGRPTIHIFLAYLLMLAGGSRGIQAEPFKAITDESQVAPYDLPEILKETGDNPGITQQAWAARRRELLDLFAKEVYGTYPTSPYRVEFEVVESGSSCGGLARRTQIQVIVSTEQGKLPIELLVFTPRESAQATLPCILSLNFTGNHTVVMDPEIPVTQAWIRNDPKTNITDNRSSEAQRGNAASRWPVELAIKNNCAVATAYYGDIDPDFDDGFENGVHGLFPEHRPSSEHPERWGSIAAWSWGLSRLLEGLAAKVSEIDAKKVFVLGHSRLGKAALWAGVTDERFAGILSNNSGCGGAALSKRIFGETVGKINTTFPHWFCRNHHQYSLHEEKLPVDQHQLLALVAPRPLYVASASEDLWADPIGEFLATKLAGEFYERLGLSRLAMHYFPKPGESCLGLVSYHLREGKHDINAWDWERYIQFAKAMAN